MDKKYIAVTEITETRAKLLLEDAGFSVKRSNLKSNDIDLKVNNNLIDVQFSFNYDKYGDIRIDVLSYFLWKNSNKDLFFKDLKSSNKSMRDLFDLHIKNKKKWKIF